MSNDNQFGLFVFNESCNVIQTEFDIDRLALFDFLFVLFLLSLVSESDLFFGFGLRLVLAQKLEKRLDFINGESVGKLVDNGRYFESLEEDSLLSLKDNVLGPLDKSCNVSLMHDVSPDSVVSWGFFEQVGVFVLVGFDGLGFFSFGHVDL